VTVTKLRPTSLELAFRLRGLGDEGSVVGQGHCRVRLVEPDTGSAITIPESVRREVLALEAGSDYCQLQKPIAPPSAVSFNMAV
jgi:acyl-CoA thioesterase FadM